MPLLVSANAGFSWSAASDAPLYTSYEPAEPPDITSLLPTYGPLIGGTANSVQVRGRNFAPMACRFGEMVSAAEFFNTSVSYCVPPSAESPRTVAFSLSHAELPLRRKRLGQSGEVSWAAPARYTYFNPESGPSVSQVTPAWGFRSTPTTLRLTGSNFVPVASLVCTFGDVTMVPASFLSSTEIACMAPSVHPEALAKLCVSSLGQVGKDCVDFDFFDAPQLLSAQPLSADKDEPALIMITGTNLPPLASSALCVFGDLGPTPATVYTTMSLLCQSPAAGARRTSS